MEERISMIGIGLGLSGSKYGYTLYMVPVFTMSSSSENFSEVSKKEI